MKKNIKRIGAVLIAGALAFAAVGCNKKEGTVSKNATVEKTEKEEQEQIEGIAKYKEFPTVPDYGKMFDKEPVSSEGNELLMTYTYSTYDDCLSDLYDVYLEFIRTTGFPADVDLSYYYMEALKHARGTEDVPVTMLYSDGQTVISTSSDIVGQTFDITVGDVSAYEYFIEENGGYNTEETTEYKPTTGEKNALKKANSYLSIMAFSYTGLIEQLEYEGYSTEEATYAVDNCGADWNEQAAKKAESYLDVMSFSKTGLIEQLEYEGFTHDQAVYGVEAAGY